MYLFRSMIFAFTRLATRVLPVMLAILVTNVARICSLSLIIQVVKKHHPSVLFAGFYNASFNVYIFYEIPNDKDFYNVCY
jgi:hypothetical protein